MIQKETYMVPIDKCGVLWVCTFHLYHGFSRKIAYTGNFIKISVKRTKALTWLKKKAKTKGFITRTKKEFYKIDGSSIKFYQNNVILLKKRLTPRGKEIFGPILYNIKRKKFINSFANRI